MNFFDAKRPALCAALFGLTACSTTSGADDGTETSGTDDSSTTTSETAEETGEVGFFDGELEFVTYESQPMVVDVVVRTEVAVDPAQSEWQWAHGNDDGVHFARLEAEGSDTEHHFRIRGLAPETAHDVSLQVMHEGTAHDAAGEFTRTA